MQDEKTNAKNISSSITPFFSPKFLPNKKYKTSKKREELINYESSVAALSGMPTVFLLTSQEDRRRRQDIFLHNLLASAL